MIHITKETLTKIQNHFTSFDAERGGALLIRENLIFDFIPLENIAGTRSSYLFSFDALNEALASYEDFDGLGIVHTHCSSFDGSSLTRPSAEDEEFYANFAAENTAFEPLLFPIVAKGKDGKPQAHWYQYKDGMLKTIEVIEA